MPIKTNPFPVPFKRLAWLPNRVWFHVSCRLSARTKELRCEKAGGVIFFANAWKAAHSNQCTQQCFDSRSTSLVSFSWFLVHGCGFPNIWLEGLEYLHREAQMHCAPRRAGHSPKTGKYQSPRPRKLRHSRHLRDMLCCLGLMECFLLETNRFRKVGGLQDSLTDSTRGCSVSLNMGGS